MSQSPDANSPDGAQQSRSDRIADVETKQRMIAEFLREHCFDAVLLQSPGNFAWMTSGTDNTRGGGPETTAALFVTPSARVVVTNNIDAVQLFEEELRGLGFQLKQRAWHESHTVLLQDLCRGRAVASDTGAYGTRNVAPYLQGMRLTMTDLEVARLRELGRRLVHSVEATARNCQLGQTEAEIAGEVSHRMVKRRVIPIRIQVIGDGRGERLRHWTYGKEPVRKYATISAVGRWHGLHLGVARTFCFDYPPNQLRVGHNRAGLMLATGMAFSKDEWELKETWKRVKRIYEKFEVPGEWQLARQAEVTGYNLHEVPLVPQSDFVLSAGMPMYWHPSVGPALMGESILLVEQGFEWLTPVENWPTLTVDVKGLLIQCPEILIRQSSAPEAEHEQLTQGDSFLGGLNDESGSEYDLDAIIVK